MRGKRDSITNTIAVAIGVSLVCSILVSTASVVLKPRQEANETRYRQRIVLEVAGTYTPGIDIEQQYAAVDTRLVDLSSGDYVTAVDADEFEAGGASELDEETVPIPEELDVAGLGRRSKYSTVYFIRENGAVSQVILPVHGRGLWSTMYGFLALGPDGRTIKGLRFYQHAETPGLGDQIDRAEWLAKWPGKQLFDDSGDMRIEVVRGQVTGGDDAIHEVDGLSGATLTARGVTNLLRYWAGPHAFGPFLQRLQEKAEDNGTISPDLD